MRSQQERVGQRQAGGDVAVEQVVREVWSSARRGDAALSAALRAARRRCRRRRGYALLAITTPHGIPDRLVQAVMADVEVARLDALFQAFVIHVGGQERRPFMVAPAAVPLPCRDPAVTTSLPWSGGASPPRRSAGDRTRRTSRRCPARCPACRCRSTTRPSSGEHGQPIASRRRNSSHVAHFGTSRLLAISTRGAISWCGRRPRRAPTGSAASRRRRASSGGDDAVEVVQVRRPCRCRRRRRGGRVFGDSGSRLLQSMRRRLPAPSPCTRACCHGRRASARGRGHGGTSGRRRRHCIGGYNRRRSAHERTTMNLADLRREYALRG